MELSTDLMGIVGTYTVPSVTYLLVTLSSGLAIRLAYCQRTFWRNKVAYETRGLIFDDPVVWENSSNYHTYYRIINQREYGDAGIIDVSGELIPIPERAHGAWAYLSQIYVATETGLAVYEYRDGDLIKESEIRTKRRVVGAFGTFGRHFAILEDGRVCLENYGPRLDITHSEPVVEIRTIPLQWFIQGKEVTPGHAMLRRDGTIINLADKSTAISDVTWLDDLGCFDRTGRLLVDRLIPSGISRNRMMLSGQPLPASSIHGKPAVCQFPVYPPTLQPNSNILLRSAADLTTALVGVDGLVRFRRSRDRDTPPEFLPEMILKSAHSMAREAPIAVIY